MIARGLSEGVQVTGTLFTDGEELYIENGGYMPISKDSFQRYAYAGDKTGEPIFIRDIVRYADTVGQVYIGYVTVGECGDIVLRWFNDGGRLRTDLGYWTRPAQITVIGNMVTDDLTNLLIEENVI